jgi:hypothetical protein
LDGKGKLLLHDVTLTSSSSGWGKDSLDVLWNIDSTYGIVPVGGVSSNVWLSSDCTTGKLQVEARILRTNSIKYPVLNENKISLGAGDWANRQWDSMTYFKGTRLLAEPQILSYYADGRCQGTSTDEFKRKYESAYGLWQFLKDETYYVDWQYWLLSPIDRPSGSGQGVLVPSY